MPPSVTCGRPRGHWHFSRACHATPPSEKPGARRVLQAAFRLAERKVNQADLQNHWCFSEVRGRENAERPAGLASDWLLFPPVISVYASVTATSPPPIALPFILFRS